MAEQNEYRDIVVRKCNERGEFTKLEDGFVYYFPSGGGGLSEIQLRIIADEMERLNKEWLDEFNAYWDGVGGPREA